jgi:dihydroorotate dehydrogenase (NAD+) catalytic subunit
MVSAVDAPRDPRLEVEVCGIRFHNPILTASGCCGYGLEFEPLFDLSRIGGVCTKGLSARPLQGNPPQRVQETAAGMLNAIGLQNIGARAFVEQKLPRLRAYDTRVVCNVFGYTVEDYVEAIEILNDGDGIDGYELNISCPNVKEGGLIIGNDPCAAAEVTEAVKRAARRPVIVKLSPNISDVAGMARALESAGADALSLINTLVGMAVDTETRRPRLANVTGGLSGPAVKPVAVRMVWQAASAVKIPVVGIGGIATAEDAVEFLIAGATAVQIGTASFYDPLATVKAVAGLSEFLDRHGVASVRDLVGTIDLETRAARGH